MQGSDEGLYDILWELANLQKNETVTVKMGQEAFYRLLAIARINGLLGIALFKLREAPAGCRDAWQTAKRAWQGEVVQSLRVRRHAATLLAKFREESIPAVIIKGNDFADHLFEQPKLRQTSDVDILVPRERWMDAAQMLERTNHIEKKVQPPMFLSSGVVSERTWTYPTTFTMDVDLHWSLVHLPVFRRQASVDFWSLDWDWPEHSATGELSDASRLVIAVVHALYHHQFERFIQIVDIQQACRRLSSESDYRRARYLAERTGTALGLNVALRVASRLLGDGEIDTVRRNILGELADRQEVPEPLYLDARQNMRRIRTHFNMPGRQRIRNWLLRQPSRPEPGWEFRPLPPKK